MNLKVKKSLEGIDYSGSHISEQEYLTECGSTRISLQFWKMVKSRVGNITHAKMTFSEKDWYNFYLRTENDAVIQFRGFAGGYGGEGPSGCYEVLKDAGFSEELARTPYNKETFFIAKEAQ